MKYIVDRFYKNLDNNLDKVYRVASEALIDSIQEYKARLGIDDGKKAWFFGIKNIPEKNFGGIMRGSSEERQKAFKEFLDRCFANSMIAYRQNYILTDSNGRELITMHDDYANSYFDLTSEDYKKVSEAFEKNGLPKDALFPMGNQIIFRKLVNKARRIFLIPVPMGYLYKYFSPKEWEALDEEKKKDISNNWEREK